MTGRSLVRLYCLLPKERTLSDDAEEGPNASGDFHGACSYRQLLRVTAYAVVGGCTHACAHPCHRSYRTQARAVKWAESEKPTGLAPWRLFFLVSRTSQAARTEAGAKGKGANPWILPVRAEDFSGTCGT